MQKKDVVSTPKTMKKANVAAAPASEAVSMRKVKRLTKASKTYPWMKASFD